MNRQQYEGDFVESADLMRSGQVTLTIAAVVPPGTERSKDGRPIDLPIIAFEGATKRFVCSKTNERIVKAIHGPKVADWVGKQITLQVRYLRQAFGEWNVPTLRVVPPEGIPIPMAARKYFGKSEPFSPEELKRVHS